MCKEEFYQQFSVLAVELWEQRANTYVLLRVLKGVREKASDRLNTVALFSRKRRKKKQERGRIV